MKLTLQLICFFSVTIAFGQNEKLELQKWLVSLNNMEKLETKIDSIKSKIITDKYYNVKPTQNNVIFLDRPFNYKCKIMFFVQRKRKMQVIINDSYLLSQIDSKTIKSVYVFDTLIAPTKYGSRGQCGTVILEANKKFKGWKKRS